MSETTGKDRKARVNRAQRKPERESLLTPTLADSQHGTSRSLRGDGYPQGSGLLPRAPHGSRVGEQRTTINPVPDQAAADGRCADRAFPDLRSVGDFSRVPVHTVDPPLGEEQGLIQTRPLFARITPLHHGPRLPIVQLDQCPRRPAGELQQSREPAGILSDDVVFRESASRLYIQDFAINSATLPPNVTSDADWQRVMSYIVGDPSMQASVTGYTDCTGTQAENLSLRRRRAETVIAAMPQNARSKVLFSGSYSTAGYLAPNTTAQERARNRAVTVYYLNSTARGQDRCDMVSQAGNLDEYIFLVRCLEGRLNLTRASNTPTALSVLRQIYYGSASWSASQTSVWDYVITGRPWSPGTDPRPSLGNTLFTALRNSQVVEGVDIGHLLTGIDAMMNPQQVAVGSRFSLQTGLANEEWATWAGDVGSAAAHSALDSLYMTSRGNHGHYFRHYAGADDLMGNIDSFAMRRGLDSARTPQRLLGQTIRLSGSLSEMLLQYYRITSGAAGQAQSSRIRDFVTAYGGVLAGNNLTNRAALTTRLRTSVDEFARLFALRELFRRGDPPTRPPGSPDFGTLITAAIDAMTRFFVDWLIGQL